MSEQKPIKHCQKCGYISYDCVCKPVSETKARELTWVGKAQTVVRKNWSSEENIAFIEKSAYEELERALQKAYQDHPLREAWEKSQTEITRLKAELEAVQTQNFKFQEQHKGCANLIETCDKLRAELENVTKIVKTEISSHEETLRDFADCRTQLSVAKEAGMDLLKWLIHKSDCAGVQGVNEDFGVPCTCGLSDALARITGEA